jgi:hypothetical protein
MDKLFYRTIFGILIVLSLHIFFREQEMQIIQAVADFMYLTPEVNNQAPALPETIQTPTEVQTNRVPANFEAESK